MGRYVNRSIRLTALDMDLIFQGEKGAGDGDLINSKLY